MEEREKKAFKLIRSQPNYEWSGRVIEFLLAYSGYDPFASIEAYKNRTSGWKLRLTERWHRLSTLLATYVSVKTLTIFYIRWCLVGLDSKQKKHQMSGPEWLLWFLGDPYSIPPHPSLIMYVMYPLLAFWLKSFMPIYMVKVEHFDCSIARFILEPAEEIRQSDLQASQLLKDTGEAIEHQRWILSRNFRLEQRSHEDFELFFAKQNHIHRQLNTMRKLERQIHLARPKALGPDWHQLNRRFAPFLSALMIIGYVTIGGSLVVHFDFVAWNGRCGMRSSRATSTYPWDESECPLFEALGLPDLLVMLEVNLSFFMFSQIPGGVIITFLTLQTVHQLLHTCNEARELCKLLTELRNWNRNQHVEVNGGSISDHLLRKLCTNLVRIQIFERESRKSVGALSHGTRMSVAFCLSYTALMFASARFLASWGRQSSPNNLNKILAASATLDIQKSMTFLLVSWVSSMLTQTSIQFACASIPSRIAHIDKLVYSLVAELIRIQQTGRTANDLERLKEHDCCFPMDDPITHLWRRQMLSRRSSDDRAAVCVFGTKFTYERVLAMQFYYATIISILYSFIK